MLIATQRLAQSTDAFERPPLYTRASMRSSLALLAPLSIAALSGCPKTNPPVENQPIVSNVSASDAGASEGGSVLGGLFSLGAAAVQLTRDVLNPFARRSNSGDLWTWHAIEHRDDRPGSSFVQQCPANGALSASVWGTTIYTDDSSICTAAVHAGVITREQGGSVRVFVHGPRNGFVGSGDHDVLTRSYQWFPGSFAFTESVAEDVFPPPQDGGTDAAPTHNDAGNLQRRAHR